MPPSLTEQLGKGAIFGAMAGAGIGFAGYIIKQKQLAASDLGVEVEHLRTDPAFMEILSRFKPLSEINDESRSLYRKMVQHSEMLKSMQARQVKGGEQIKVNRVCVSITTTCKALSKQALKSRDLGIAPLPSDVEELEAIVNNILHNIMMDN